MILLILDIIFLPQIWFTQWFIGAVYNRDPRWSWSNAKIVVEFRKLRKHMATNHCIFRKHYYKVKHLKIIAITCPNFILSFLAGKKTIFSIYILIKSFYFYTLFTRTIIIIKYHSKETCIIIYNYVFLSTTNYNFLIFGHVVDRKKNS